MRQRRKGFILSQRFLLCYRKNTLAIFFSFALTFMLATAMLVLLHTNHRVENIQYEAIYTPSDCYIEGLSAAQLEQLSEYPDIEHLAVEMEGTKEYMREGQPLFVSQGDDVAHTMTATLLEGRLPDTPDEVAAERWVLLNLGIEPDINQEFTIQDEKGRNKTVKLVGILSDMMRNKMYATLFLYAGMEKVSGNSYMAYLRLKNPDDYQVVMKDVLSELGARKKQLHKNPAREDYQELYRMDVQALGVIFLVCLVVFYGIYRIALAARQKQYGILRALGMKRRQLQRMILLELYQIYWIGALVGIVLGLIVSAFIVKLSGDGDMVVYLYNESVRFTPVVPAGPIVFSAIAMAVFVGLTGWLTGRKIARRPAVEAICGTVQDKKRTFRFFRLKNGNRKRRVFGLRSTGGKQRSLFTLSCRYICQDIRTSAFMILTICVGVVLFTGLAYRAEIVSTIREDTRETWYLNGQYEMGLMTFQSPFEGLSRKNAEKIKRLPEVEKIKTAAGMPVRVVDENGVARNDAYYEDMNARYKESYGYEFRGYDGTNQIYKSVLYGYNTEALSELKKYVVSGNFDPENLKEDEIIVSVLSMYGQSKIPGAYRNGEPLMDYHAGDTIELKYRADFKTDRLDYEMLNDTNQKYIYQKYKIAAIVYFPYILDSRRTIYPLMITGDSQIQKIVPDGCLQNVYIDTGDKELPGAKQDSLERELIRIGTGEGNCYVRTRSMTAEIKRNEMFYQKQMVYLYSIAIVAFVLALINMINNLSYRMHARTREICMLRAVGLSIAMAKRIMMYENAVLSAAAIVVSFILSQPVLRYLYQISLMEAEGHRFSFQYHAFLGISAAAVLLCIALSRKILQSWKTRQIMEAIGKAE